MIAQQIKYDVKADFERLLLGTKRPGIDSLVRFLEDKTDFLKAPASIQYHDSCPGGLLKHSMTVYNNLRSIVDETGIYPQPITPGTAEIVALLHDVCKVNFYKLELKHRKIIDSTTGRSHWEDYNGYVVDDQLPLGHGEKSVMIIQQYINLTREELLAINWHMAGFDDRIQGYAGSNALSAAMRSYPLIVALHMADLTASYFPGKDGGD